MPVNAILNHAECIETVNHSVRVFLDCGEYRAYEREPRCLRNVHNKPEVE